MLARYYRGWLTGFVLVASLFSATRTSAQSVFVEGASSEFGTLDVTTGVFTSLGTTAVPLDGLAFNSSGTLFGIDNTGSTLYTVNPTNGALTTIGGTGAAVAAGSAGIGLAFSPSGSLFLLTSRPEPERHSLHRRSRHWISHAGWPDRESVFRFFLPSLAATCTRATTRRAPTYLPARTCWIS